MDLGSVKSGVLLGLMQHPSIVQQLQLLQDDQLIPPLAILLVVAKILRILIELMMKNISPKSPWRGLVDLVIATIEPTVAFSQMIVGMMLSRVILHYTNQDYIGMIVTTGLGIIVDAVMRFKTPLMRF
jgi:hypothetical protein